MARQEYRVVADLTARGYRLFLPQEVRRVAHRAGLGPRRMKDVHLPLFQNYVFLGLLEGQSLAQVANMIDTRDIQREWRIGDRVEIQTRSVAHSPDKIPGVVGLLRNAAMEPKVIPTDQIELIRKCEELGLFDERPRERQWSVGDKAMVEKGRLVELAVTITKLDRNGRWAWVMSDLFTSRAPTRVEVNRLRPAIGG